MKLIVGLGNPGLNYAKTRHNLGFLAVDYLKQEAGILGDWRPDDKFKTALAEGQVGEEKIILAKPQTMMNLSGLAAKSLTDYYKIAPEDLWVIHDDMDLPLGVLRISQGSGSAGHKGVHSIIDVLKTKNFVRFRLGIHPVGQTFFTCLFKRLKSNEKFVLQKFSKQEETNVQEVIGKTRQAIQLALKEGLEKAKNQFN
ncbi:aminoacyl-tRNA hydrolase [Patescibacteria group bacterium]|nr:aminoacyl-tRNA hydrolase [Patescibacteria group bacterium]